MWKRIGIDVLPLTPHLVQYMASLPTFRGDRQRDSVAGRRRIEWLARLIQEGRFYDPEWATAELNGKLYRVNGGHSTAALSLCNGHFPAGLNAVIRRFHCEDEKDLADLFDHFDTGKSTRSITDRIKAHGAVESELSDVKSTYVKYAISGIAAYLSDFGESGQLSTDESIQFLHQHQSFIVFARQFNGERRLRDRGPMAAMFACYDKNHSLASTFWEEVRDESNPDNTSPTRILSVFLRDQKGEESSKRFDMRAIYAKCIHAANAWQAGKSTDLKYHHKAALPVLRWPVGEHVAASVDGA